MSLSPSCRISVKYLGLRFSTTGVEKSHVYNLVGWIDNLHSAPDQKFHMLNRYIIPRLYYGLQSTTIPDNILGEMDGIVRTAVKCILHLSGHTGSQFIHANIRDGGLGVTQFRYQIPFVLMRRIDRLRALDNIFDGLLKRRSELDVLNRMNRLSANGPPQPYWHELITTRVSS